MNVKIINDAIATIQALDKGAFRYEWAPRMAEELRLKVLESIAAGTCIDPGACCKAVLVTVDMDFAGDLS